ncbi:MAG: saccharopine dehydrogenase NADP-binding domain-containing protein [Deltaproteobacteria bacterium]|nr:saccharopine dehydrogenase NADP-binding domain-containing protein [Deltaproteobacteria bacterium]
MSNTRSVLVLGAGFVSRPLVQYLLGTPWIRLTVADRILDNAERVVEGHPHASAIPLDVEDGAALDALVTAHDLVVSLLPAPLHPRVAERCLDHGKDLATTSYISPAMQALDGPAREKGLLFLNECGVDPGIDHMSAMRIFHDVWGRDGRITGFKSYCGGLPAPESSNRVDYKFSWSARAVLVAALNSARFLWDGKLREVPAGRALTDIHHLEVEGVGSFDAYPNRDSLEYQDRYGLDGATTVYRGTLRYPGHCARWQAWIDAGLFDFVSEIPEGATLASIVRGILGVTPEADLAAAMAARLGVDVSHEWVESLRWFGMFSDDPPGEYVWSPGGALATAMLEHMQYEPGQRDMILMHHEVVSAFPDHRERTTMNLVDFGIPGGDSSMARTVSLPLAVAVRTHLERPFGFIGVHGPLEPEMFEPILAELEEQGITCRETTEILERD